MLLAEKTFVLFLTLHGITIVTDAFVCKIGDGWNDLWNCPDNCHHESCPRQRECPPPKECRACPSCHKCRVCPDCSPDWQRADKCAREKISLQNRFEQNQLETKQCQTTKGNEIKDLQDKIKRLNKRDILKSETINELEEKISRLNKSDTMNEKTINQLETNIENLQRINNKNRGKIIILLIVIGTLVFFLLLLVAFVLIYVFKFRKQSTVQMIEQGSGPITSEQTDLTDVDSDFGSEDSLDSSSCEAASGQDGNTFTLESNPSSNKWYRNPAYIIESVRSTVSNIYESISNHYASIKSSTFRKRAKITSYNFLRPGEDMKPLLEERSDGDVEENQGFESDREFNGDNESLLQARQCESTTYNLENEINRETSISNQSVQTGGRVDDKTDLTLGGKGELEQDARCENENTSETTVEAHGESLITFYNHESATNGFTQPECNNRISEETDSDSNEEEYAVRQDGHHKREEHINNELDEVQPEELIYLETLKSSEGNNVLASLDEVNPQNAGLHLASTNENVTVVKEAACVEDNKRVKDIPGRGENVKEKETEQDIELDCLGVASDESVEDLQARGEIARERDPAQEVQEDCIYDCLGDTDDPNDNRTATFTYEKLNKSSDKPQYAELYPPNMQDILTERENCPDEAAPSESGLQTQSDSETETEEVDSDYL